MHVLQFVIGCVLASLVARASAQPRALEVMPTSTLVVHGKTNVNRFTCDVRRYVARDTLRYTLASEAETIRFDVGSIRVAGRAFDCRNPIMTSDFRQTLRVKEHPTVEIRLLRIVGWAAATAADRPIGQRRTVATQLEIVVAGREQRVELPCELVWLRAGEVRLVGTGDFRFSDFGLTPPERLFGAVRVAQEIEVGFDLHLRVVNDRSTGAAAR